jgi:hypothetical protein
VEAALLGRKIRPLLGASTLVLTGPSLEALVCRNSGARPAPSGRIASASNLCSE